MHVCRSRGAGLFASSACTAPMDAYAAAIVVLPNRNDNELHFHLIVCLSGPKFCRPRLSAGREQEHRWKPSSQPLMKTSRAKTKQVNRAFIKRSQQDPCTHMDGTPPESHAHMPCHRLACVSSRQVLESAQLNSHYPDCHCPDTQDGSQQCILCPRRAHRPPGDIRSASARRLRPRFGPSSLLSNPEPSCTPDACIMGLQAYLFAPVVSTPLCLISHRSLSHLRKHSSIYSGLRNVLLEYADIFACGIRGSGFTNSRSQQVGVAAGEFHPPSCTPAHKSMIPPNVG